MFVVKYNFTVYLTVDHNVPQYYLYSASSIVKIFGI
jgi:hypothetical protein